MKRIAAMTLVVLMMAAAAAAAEMPETDMNFPGLKTELGAPEYKADALHAPLDGAEKISLLDFGSLFSINANAKDLIGDDPRAAGAGIDLASGATGTMTKPEGFGAPGQKSVPQTSLNTELKDYSKKILIP